MIWGVSAGKNTAELHTTLDAVKHFSLPLIGKERNKAWEPSWPFGIEVVQLPPHVPCLCWGQVLAQGKADLWVAIPHGNAFTKTASTIQASLPHVSPCVPGSVLTPQLPFFARQIPSTHPSCIHLSPSLPFLLLSSPATINKLISPVSMWISCQLEAGLHTYPGQARPVSAPFPCSPHLRSLHPPRAETGHPSAWQGK